MKKCPTCQEEKNFSDFRKNSSKADGLATQCALCASKQHKMWKSRNPDRWLISVTRSHLRKLRDEHGIDPQSVLKDL